MTSSSASTASAAAPLRVLIAEDEFLVGSILEESLQDSGYEVVGILQSLARLREAVNLLAFDLAILDINLAGEMVYPVADDLRARGKPFILVTGYGARNLPGTLKDARLLAKPCAFSELEKAMLQVWEAKAKSPILVEARAPDGPRAATGPAVPEASATLGDVLYAKAPGAVSEQDWCVLVQAVARGDQLALHALYERAHRPVFTLLVRLTASRETAEELTVDVFYDVWRRAAAYDPANGTVLGWIMNQTRSRAIDRMRFDNRKKRRQPDTPQVASEIAVDPKDMIAWRDQCESLQAALAVLTSDERQAIETAFFGERTYVEAAALLNLPLGTVKTRIRSALHKLRAALGAETGMS